MSKKFHSVHPAGASEGPEPSDDVVRRAQGVHPLVAALLVSALATGTSYAAPGEHVSSVIALVFLGGTYVLCLRRSHPLPPDRYGLSLGGLMSDAPLSYLRMARETARALLIASFIACVILPPFYFGFVFWHAPQESFDVARAFTWEGQSSPWLWVGQMTLWHVVSVALPEEAFFRGYLQSSLLGPDATARPTFPRLVAVLFLVSAVFALGHFATEPSPARLAVFFPSLLFGAVRHFSGGIGAAVFFHAQCNLFSQWLGQGYGLF